MANRYWVGGTGTWSTGTGNWSTSSAIKFTASCSGTTLTTTGSPALVVGMTVFYSTSSNLGTITGGSGNTWTVSVGGTVGSQTMTAATVGNATPSTADDVYFDSNSSNDVAFTVTISGFSRNFRNLDASGLTSNMTLTVSGTVQFNCYGTTYNLGSAFLTQAGSNFQRVYFAAAAGSTITVTPRSGSLRTTQIQFANAVTLNLGAALNSGTNYTTTTLITGSTVNTNNYAFEWTNSGGAYSGFGGSTINAGSSTISITIVLSVSLFNLGTFNAGTSTLTVKGQVAQNAQLSADTSTISVYDIAFSAFGGSNYNMTILKAMTCRNLTINPRTSDDSVWSFLISSSVTASGTFSIPAPSSPGKYRIFVGSTNFKTAVTISAAAVSLADVVFSDISATGAAAPFTGTRIGNGGGCSGITFTAARNVYWVATAGPSDYPGPVYGASSGGAASYTDNPLPQDTIIVDNASLSGVSHASITGFYTGPVGNIDCSSKTTTNAVYLTSAYAVGTAYTGSASTSLAISGFFYGRSAVTFTNCAALNNIENYNSNIPLSSLSGTIRIGGYAAALTGNLSCTTFTFGTRSYYGSALPAPSLDLGSYTLSAGGFGAISTLTVTGTGTISLNSASAQTFAGAGVTYPCTVDIGGAGAVTVTGSNTFANFTNSYSATGATTIKFTGGTTNTFTAFNITGTAGKVCTLTSTTTTQATLYKPSTWYMGANSTDGGNNTGLTFTAGDGIDYLAVSYIKGTSPSAAGGKFLMFF